MPGAYIQVHFRLDFIMQEGLKLSDKENFCHFQGKVFVLILNSPIKYIHITSTSVENSGE